MARELAFIIKNKEYKANPVKIDRKKLYGWTKIVAVDDNGDECKLVSTDDTGTLIIPAGGTGLGMLSPEGKWVERSELTAVDNDGEAARLQASSFAGANKLEEKISVEEFLDHSITDFYELENSDKAFIKVIGNDIYMFEYSYHDSYEKSPAFLLVADGRLYMLTGYKNVFNMLCLGECGTPGEEEDLLDYDDSTDNLDFTMFY